MCNWYYYRYSLICVKYLYTAGSNWSTLHTNVPHRLLALYILCGLSFLSFEENYDFLSHIRSLASLLPPQLLLLVHNVRVLDLETCYNFTSVKTKPVILVAHTHTNNMLVLSSSCEVFLLLIFYQVIPEQDVQHVLYSNVYGAEQDAKKNKNKGGGVSLSETCFAHSLTKWNPVTYVGFRICKNKHHTGYFHWRA